MVSVRLSVRPGADLGFRTSMDGQDQVLKSRSLDGRGGRRRRMAAANMVFVRLSVCPSGQKLGSAWKILPVTARSTCSCDLIVQHVRTQSLASVISAKRLAERWTKQRCATLWNVTSWKESGCQSCCCCRRRNDDLHNNRCWYCSKLRQDSKSFFSSTNSVLRQVDL